jgi:hypothetical protein
MTSPMRDEDDRGSLVLQPTHQAEDHFSSLARKRCRRLVKHEQPRIEADGAGDFDHL